ncbi:aminoglycoside phosphotransferase family protein [Paenibacillus sp. Marseille-Q4541]|uniref:phosphotransferase family protein n=1 Tax=Paenibacillus sp. Marseille-Q4541 TaxID=2831522 RepID=UPI001BAE3A75|nr:aminoglycoside phosphotransferase family protein [Paenibacillus sp. Marseille-Q4541]
MTTRIYFSAPRMADIKQSTLQDMLSRWNLGTLYSYKPTDHGMMKQTLFIYTSSGNYVFKGNPLFPGQWKEEKFIIDQLSIHTNAPVPMPYLMDTNEDLFGYSYALMPLLPGVHYHDLDLHSLTEDEHSAILILLAATLVDLHGWETALAGEYDPGTDRIQPFDNSYYHFLEHQIMYWLEDARKYAPIKETDVTWVREQMISAEAAFRHLNTYSFVMGDYKSENILLQQHTDKWKVSGVFDFTTAYFGDPLADVVKFTNQLLWKGQQKEAALFLTSYLQRNDRSFSRNDVSSRLTIHFLYSLILKWGEAHATGQIDTEEKFTFREFASRHLEMVRSLY